MDPARDALPDDITTLKEALATERAKALDIAAEPAVAHAKASEDSAPSRSCGSPSWSARSTGKDRNARLAWSTSWRLRSKSWKPAPPKTSLRPRKPSPGQ